MTNNKRYILCWLLIIAWWLALPHVMRLAGFDMAPKKPAAKIAAEKSKEKAAEPDGLAKLDGPATAAELKKGDQKATDLAKIEPAKKPDGPALAPGVELLPVQPVLGSVTDKSPEGYRMEVQLTQKDAGIEAVYSSRYDAEFEFGRAKKAPLLLIGPSGKRRGGLRFWPPSLAITLASDKAPAAPGPAADAADQAEEAREGEPAFSPADLLQGTVWEAVKDEKGNVVRPVTKADPVTKSEITGQSVVFRTKADNGVTITKTYRLFPNTDGLEVALRFESPEKEQTVVYNLLGPHGIPIEGEWYTSTFRDVVFGQLDGGEVKPVTNTASDVVAATKPIDNTKLPLVFAGVENQYFATLIEPAKRPTGDSDRLDASALAIFLKRDEAPQKSDVGIRLTSRPIKVGPNVPVEHEYKIFAGPKTAEALKDYHAEVLASYRKGGWFSIPFAPYLARYVITPTLAFTYDVTARVSRLFGGTKGNYGVAIIMLTMLVRLVMFPLGRKQALSAQKMQLLQPALKELQDKMKDDKERLTKETFALYKKHGVNPVGGCLPALIQLPIFVGLWQALNTSFRLRHAPFLWIRDLSAPDMMFHLPFDIPFLGQWFNALPFVVVSLMLLQTKLFSPPPTTPEAEMQQKTMKYMMIVMGAMFYKVPSGLGLYFITSSGWAICERLLLPKMTHAHLEADAVAKADAADAKGTAGRAGGSKALSGANGASPKGPADAEPKPPGKLAQFWEKVLDEARKDPTYRKIVESPDGKARDPQRPRPKPRKR
jgi:YidC/Oxa1 family membrane protein insertase